MDVASDEDADAPPSSAKKARPVSTLGCLICQLSLPHNAHAVLRWVEVCQPYMRLLEGQPGHQIWPPKMRPKMSLRHYKWSSVAKERVMSAKWVDISLHIAGSHCGVGNMGCAALAFFGKYLTRKSEVLS